jgi:hypothetical protein
LEKNDKQNHWEIQGKTNHFNWTARVNYFAIINRGKRLVQAKKSPAKNSRKSTTFPAALHVQKSANPPSFLHVQRTQQGKPHLANSAEFTLAFPTLSIK